MATQLQRENLAKKKRKKQNEQRIKRHTQYCARSEKTRVSWESNRKVKRKSSAVDSLKKGT